MNCKAGMDVVAKLNILVPSSNRARCRSWSYGLWHRVVVW